LGPAGVSRDGVRQLDVARELALPLAVRDLEQAVVELERRAPVDDRFGGRLGARER
jgi:hypothetical protein